MEDGRKEKGQVRKSVRTVTVFFFSSCYWTQSLRFRALSFRCVDCSLLFSGVPWKFFFKLRKTCLDTPYLLAKSLIERGHGDSSCQLDSITPFPLSVRCPFPLNDLIGVTFWGLFIIFSNKCQKSKNSRKKVIIFENLEDLVTVISETVTKFPCHRRP